MKKIVLLAAFVLASFTLSAQYKAPQIIANCGYHKAPSSGVRNSMSALKAAQKQKVYASKCDVSFSRDLEMMAMSPGWHPNSKAKKKVHTSRADCDRILSIPYTTGEYPSTVEDILMRGAKKPKTKIMLELRSQGTTKRETDIADLTVALVDQCKMQDNVIYSTYSLWVCCEVLRLAPKGTSVCFMGPGYTPEYVKGLGCDIFGCHIGRLKKNQWILRQARKLGIKVNAWSVNREADIVWCIKNGVDYISTDEVKLAKELIKEYCKK